MYCNNVEIVSINQEVQKGIFVSCTNLIQI